MEITYSKHFEIYHPTESAQPLLIESLTTAVGVVTLITSSYLLLLLGVLGFSWRRLGGPSSGQQGAQQEERKVQAHQHERLHDHARLVERVRDDHLLVVLLHNVLRFQNQHRSAAIELRVQVGKSTTHFTYKWEAILYTWLRTWWLMPALLRKGR